MVYLVYFFNWLKIYKKFFAMFINFKQTSTGEKTLKLITEQITECFRNKKNQIYHLVLRNNKL